MSNKEHIWIPRLKQQLADRRSAGANSFATRRCSGCRRARPICGPARSPASRSPRPRAPRNCPRGVSLKVAMRIPKLDNPHTFSWIYDFELRPPGQRLSDPHRRRQRHAAGARQQMGGHRRISRPGPSPLPTSSGITGAPSPPRTPRGTSSTASIRRTGSSVLGLMKGYMLKEVDKGKKDDKGNPSHVDRAVGRQRHRRSRTRRR